jgi:thioredoxin 2
MATLVVSCPACGKKNRVDTDRAGARCGACGEGFARVEKLGDATFRGFIVGSPLPVLVDFSAVWCGPCRMVAPIVEEVALLRGDKLRVANVDIDEARATAEKFGVTAVPTLVLLKGPKELARLEGALPKAELLRWIDATLAGAGGDGARGDGPSRSTP